MLSFLYSDHPCTSNGVFWDQDGKGQKVVSLPLCVYPFMSFSMGVKI